MHMREPSHAAKGAHSIAISLAVGLWLVPHTLNPECDAEKFKRESQAL